MILYLADKQFNVLETASTGLRRGTKVLEDTLTRRVADGDSFECVFDLADKTLAEAEGVIFPTSNIIMLDGDTVSVFAILETEYDSESREMRVYAESGGLDLLNTIVGEYTGSSVSVATSVNAAISGTGWEIGENEISDRRRTVEFTGTDTAVKRLYEIAAAFDAEITFSYDIDGLNIVGRYVDIRQRIGKDVDAYLRTGREIQRIIVKRSAAELATAVWPQCDDAALPTYDDGDMYVSGGILYSRDALSRWARADGGHIVKTYDSEAKTAQSLLDGAKRSLSIARELETTYEVDLASLPEGVGIGDRIHLVDESDGIYLSARILELETSETSGTRKATLGEIEEEAE